MSDYIITCDEETPSWIGNNVDLMKPVVRCKDCKYMFDWAYDRMLCKMLADGGMDDDAKNVLYPTVKPDGYCAWGKRRGDAK